MSAALTMEKGIMMTFKRMLQCLAFLCVASTPALAQDSTTRLIVGYAPGGGNDLSARIIAEALGKSAGRPFIVENKPGASGQLAAEFVTRAKPDGGTLLATGNSAISMAAAIYPKLNYDPIKDLVPVAIIADYPQLVMIVAAGHPARTFAEFVSWSKANPEKSNYAAVAPAYTIPTEQLKLVSGLQAQAISYKSSSEALVGVLNGQISFLLGDHNTTLSTVSSGQTRALLVTGADRIAALPEIPSAGELGYSEVSSSLWTGIFAPKGTTPEQAQEIAGLISDALKEQSVQEKLHTIGVKPGKLVTGEFGAQIVREVAGVRAVVKAAGLKFE
ncbi:tripartite tricarboxylate transporter substrate binding protein [Agrobacterium sp. T29]|uniref:Bug family tripartite tricarboxylate transporter substrate binding protein n=1 Tax=Agrobacterium sp. T29 TaxID=2580515 RepID=UPI00115EBE4C|nr:tripartite tricarboxylate transporter substrate binding protein [Agrobacterium sp. T29]